MTACRDVDYVLRKLDWMRQEGIWPNGLRYLWTDAFGVVLLASLAAELKDEKYLDQAEQLVDDVYRVLGRTRGIRIGEAADRDGQYFHYLAMWMYALSVLAQFDAKYRRLGIDLVKQTHARFVVPGHGVVWKMRENLSAPYPGYGFGALDALDGCFIRDPRLPNIKFAFTNYGVSLGLQAVGKMPERVQQINRFFESWHSGDEYDREAITHVMACTSHFPGLMIANGK